MMRVMAIGAAAILGGALLVGCDDGPGRNPFGFGTTPPPSTAGQGPTDRVDPIDSPVPPPSPATSTRPTVPPRTRPPTTTASPDLVLTAAQARILVDSVALSNKDWGPEYVAQEQDYESTGLTYAATDADCRQVAQGTVPGGLATMTRRVYVPTGGKPAVDNLSKTLALSTATAYTSAAQARADVTKSLAEARRCPTQTLGNDEKLTDIQVVELSVPGLDEIHAVRSNWVANHGGSTFRYVWVTARQGPLVLAAAVVDRSDKTFESAKDQAIDAIAVMVTRANAQLR